MNTKWKTAEVISDRSAVLRSIGEVMSTAMKTRDYRSWEYLEVVTDRRHMAFYMDGYESFGWQQDETMPPKVPDIRQGTANPEQDRVVLYLKRSRKLVSRTELTRLQRQFEADATEIKRMKEEAHNTALAASLALGLAGCGFAAGAALAVSSEVVSWQIHVVMTILAFACWLGAWLVNGRIQAIRDRKTRPFIEQKYREIEAVCEKGRALL